MDSNFIHNITKNSIAKAVIVAAVIVAGAVVYLNYGGTSCSKDQISAQDAANKTIEYINKNILRGQATASLVGVTEENDLYRIKFAIKEQEIESYVTKNGKLLFPEISNAIDMSKAVPETVQQTGETVGNFSVSDAEICKENEKASVYFFGSDACPHCKWEKPIFENVVAKFGDKLSVHKNITNKLSEPMPADENVFAKYNPGGGVPLVVLGCKYYRGGSGENLGAEQEAKVLTALICKLTDNQPNDVCGAVQDEINKIN